MNPAALKKLVSWYEGTLLSRIHKDGRVLSVGTRWEKDDIIGSILEEDGWTVVNLPVYAEEEDILGRSPGDVLWPEHLDKDFIEDKRKRMGEFWFQCEYMNNPVPLTGNMINPDLIKRFDRTQSVRSNKVRIMYVDMAFTDGNLNPRADETCITILDFDTNQFYLQKQYAGRWSTDQSKQEMMKAFNYWKPDTALIEEVSASKIMINDMMALGYPFRGFNPGQAKKEARIMELIPYIESERLLFKYGEDWSVLLEQIRAFPMGRMDDRLDSLWGAIHNIAKSLNPFTKWDGRNSKYERAGTTPPSLQEQPKRRAGRPVSSYGSSRSGF